MKLKHAFLVLSLLVLGVIFAACTDNTPEYALNVTVVGNGTVTSDTGDIDCVEDGDGCSDDFDENTAVTLEVTPAEGATFVGFTGDCTGTTCMVTMDAARNVTATFEGGTEVPETGGPETGGPETGGPETGGPETGGPETGGEEVTATVAASTDDAEEYEGNGTDADFQTAQVFTDNDDLEFTNDGAARGDLIAGVRFAGVAIPADATVTNATIQFTAAADTSNNNNDDASFSVDVQTDVAAAAFDAANANDISSRTLSGSPISWSPDPWAPGDAGPAQQVDVTALVQAVVTGQAGATTSYDMVFVVSDDPDSTDTGVRVADAWDPNGAGAAVLTVTYTTSEED